MNELQMQKMDPEHKVSSSYKANLIFYNSGLERKEREKVFKEAGGIWNYETFNKIFWIVMNRSMNWIVPWLKRHIRIVDDSMQQRPM